MPSKQAAGTHNEIGFWRGWSIAVGCAIGSGVFMMPTLLAPYGLLGLAGWLVAGGGTLLVALSLSRLVRRVPKLGDCPVGGSLSTCVTGVGLDNYCLKYS